MKFNHLLNVWKKKPAFTIVPVSPHTKYDIEGSTVVLYRAGIKYDSPNSANILTLQTGLTIAIKRGYCAILHFPESFKKTGLVPVCATQVILPGYISQVEIPCYKSLNPHFADSAKSECPFELGDIIGFLTIVKMA